MSDAYDPDSTPNALGDVVGMDQLAVDGPPVNPHPTGELLTGEDGQPKYIAAREDGKPVALGQKSTEDSA